MVKVTPVLLSGGTGTRLWPLSREAYPKQLLPLVDTETLLQGTARRVAASDLFTDLLVIANAEHRFVIAEQLRASTRKSPGSFWSRSDAIRRPRRPSRPCSRCRRIPTP